jgi:transcriptional regulator with XRE-family HTH domain
MNVDIGQRLRQERERLAQTQADFAACVRVDRKSQVNYEAGARAPTADYLARAAELGVDVLYVLTSVRAVAAAPGAVNTGDALVLTAEEHCLVDNYRHASREGRRALEAAGTALAQSPKDMAA